MRFRYILLDFDGTLTATDRIIEPFMADFRAGFLDAVGRRHAAVWDRAEAAVRLGSPHLAWMLDKYEACPAAADPYTLASAVGERVLGSLAGTPGHDPKEYESLGYTLYKALYEKHHAPFRDETKQVLERFVATGATVAVISNSKPDKVGGRLDDLLGARSPVRQAIEVFGDARKFGVRDATAGGPHRPAFEALPDAVGAIGLGRPTWLRRGAFFDALATVWKQDANAPRDTIFCGDIWELDLALPAALGCATHLVERLPSLATTEAERAAVAAMPRAAFSKDLNGLLARVVG
ncbi:MAG: hypothetical protein ACK4YP_07810 [Myxococcota bacterium]